MRNAEGSFDKHNLKKLVFQVSANFVGKNLRYVRNDYGCHTSLDKDSVSYVLLGTSMSADYSLTLSSRNGRK